MPKETVDKKSPGTHHSTNAEDKLRQYYTPELESLVEQFYEGDYDNHVLQLEKTKIFVKYQTIFGSYPHRLNPSIAQGGK